MLSFRRRLVEEVTKLTHLEHIEDQILNIGFAGLRSSILLFLNVRDMLSGSSSGKINVTVKWDGAPSTVCGINPENGRFFVGTKSVFSKNPKLFYTQREIANAEIPPGLASKLSAALAEFPKLGITGVVQGDFLFSKEDLKLQSFKGEQLITFRPNTITYAVPKNSEMGAEILRSKVGIVFHTKYSGNTIAGLKASFGVAASEFNKVPSVWLKDTYFRDVSGQATLTKEEYDQLTAVLSDAGKMFHLLDPNVINTIIGNDELKNLIKQFNNYKVRMGEPILDTNKHVNELVTFINNKYQEDIKSLKTERGKEGRRASLTTLVQSILRNKNQLKIMFDLQNLLIFAKKIVIRKLQSANDVGTFIDDGSGLKVTSPEGFVVSDHIGNAIKLVDRIEFSRINFTLPKNWK